MPPIIPPGFGGHHDHARRGDNDRDRHRQSDPIAEKDQAEDRNLDRFGLDIGDGDHEGALAHRRQHQRGGRDLRDGAVENPRPEFPSGMRQRQSGCQHHACKKDQRERKAEQKTHQRGAERAEARRQLALHRVANGLREGGNDGKDGPEPREHHRAGTTPSSPRRPYSSRPYRKRAASGRREDYRSRRSRRSICNPLCSIAISSSFGVTNLSH